MCVTLVPGMPDTNRLDCTRIINVLTMAELMQILSFEHLIGRQQMESQCFLLLHSNEQSVSISFRRHFQLMLNYCIFIILNVTTKFLIVSSAAN